MSAVELIQLVTVSILASIVVGIVVTALIDIIRND